MTSVSTIIGTVPIALGLGAGSVSRRPLGFAIVGGILFSTLLTLYLVPAVWVMFESVRARVRGTRTAPARLEPAAEAR
jgi:HAE1 family hydrophobic/amphiphilic exporter-1